MLAALARTLQRLWWRPRLAPFTALLTPLAWLVGRVAARRRRAGRAALALPVPVIVVGNVIVGGAGKTPTVIALIQQLRADGWTPGIVSRGHGRADAAALLLDAHTPAQDVRPAAFGDEPVLMHRRTGAPVAVARRRRDAALHLLRAHPEVDIVIADDGLQHHAFPRDVEIVVFDGRGIGNGWPLPAGPLRERAEAIWPDQPGPARFILVNGRWPAPPALALPAPAERCWEARRGLGGALELAAWERGETAVANSFDALRGRTLLACAGIGDPERFFSMLEAGGLRIERLPLTDHADFDPLPWPAATREVVVTEKDAVKLAGRPLGHIRVWVVTLDFGLPQALVATLRESLSAPRPGHPSPP